MSLTKTKTAISSSSFWGTEFLKRWYKCSNIISLEEILKRHTDMEIYILIIELTVFLSKLKIRPSSDTLEKLDLVSKMYTEYLQLMMKITDPKTNPEIQTDLMNCKSNIKPVLIRDLIDLLVTTYKQELKGPVFIKS